MAARRPLLLPLLVPLLVGGEARMVRAEQRLAEHRYVIAAGVFEKELADDPASIRSRRGLGVARAGLQQCGDAFPELAAARAGGAWDVEAALAEGDCWSRQGDASAAIAAWEEALALGEAPQAWFKIAQEERGRGDLEAAAEALEALAAEEGAGVPNMLAIAAAWASLSCDGGDEGWIALAELERQVALTPSAPARVEADVVEGLLWLAAGDPQQAEAVLLRAGRVSRSTGRVAAWRAEALRRNGDPQAAIAVYDSPKAARGDLPIQLAVLARARVDLGDLDEAEALLAVHPDADDGMLLASRWYLARAQGDVAAAADAERRWSVQALPSDCPLLQLVPLESR